MFLRVRRRGRNLCASVVETRRVDGQTRQHHIAALGTLRQPVTTPAYLTFRSRVDQQLAALRPALTAAQCAAINTRLDQAIPPPTTTADLMRICRAEMPHLKFTEPSFAELVELVELARLPNVTVKADPASERGRAIFAEFCGHLSAAEQCLDAMRTVSTGDWKRTLRHTAGLRSIITGLQRLHALHVLDPPPPAQSGRPATDQQMGMLDGAVVEEIEHILKAAGYVGQPSVRAKTSPVIRISARIAAYIQELQVLPKATFATRLHSTQAGIAKAARKRGIIVRIIR